MRKIIQFTSDWLLVCLLLVVALLLRLPLINGSFWLDEAAQALESTRPFLQQLQIMPDFQPPLIHFIVHFASYIGTAEWWLRTWGALLPGLGTIVFTYLIGKKLFSKSVGFWSALLLSTSFLHIFYSQELRPYSLPAFWAALSWWQIVGRDKSFWSHKQVFSFGLVSALGLYSSYLYPFLLLSQLIWLFWQEGQQLRKWIWSFALAGGLFLPWLPSFFEQLKTGSMLRSNLPGWDQVVSFTQIKVLPLTAATFIFGELDFEATAFFVVTSVILFILIGYLVVKIYQTNLLKKLAMPIIWLLVPSLLAWVISFWVPVLQPKRVLFSLPALYLFISGGVFLLKNKIKAKLGKLILKWIVPILLVINLIAVGMYWSDPALQRENWRAVVADIESTYPDNSIVLFGFSEPFSPWVWYADPSYPAITPQTLLVTNQTQLTNTLKPINDYQYVILFDYLRDLTDPDQMLEFYLDSHDFELRSLHSVPRIGFVRIYSRPEAVLSYTQDS